MKNIVLLLLLALSSGLAAQHLEAGLSVGASNYLGDLSSNSSQFYLSETHFAGGIFTRYNFNDFGAVKLGLQFGTISGEDANSNENQIRERNLSFSSNIFELSLTGEFNILGYQPYNLSKIFSPYIFAGVALYRFNPTAEYQGERVDLQPLGTEGQGIEGRPAPYNLAQFSIPAGIGLKYAINDNWNIGLEVGVRKTFTDYLDDVSTTYVEYNKLLSENGELAAALGNRQGELLGTEPISVPTGTPRGDQAGSDWYFLAGFSISYNFLDNGLVGSRSRSRKGKGCETDF